MCEALHETLLQHSLRPGDRKGRCLRFQGAGLARLAEFVSRAPLFMIGEFERNAASVAYRRPLRYCGTGFAFDGRFVSLTSNQRETAARSGLSGSLLESYRAVIFKSGRSGASPGKVII